MASDHPAFRAPSNPDVILSRYMDLTKFADMLSRQSIFFCRSDQLGDPFEGSLPRLNREDERITKYAGASPAELERYAGEASRLRMWTMISCWHANEHESMAMWRWYAGKDGALMVQTTYRLMFELLPEQVHIGEVTYLDYEADRIEDNDNTFKWYLHKRKAFEYEKEVRAICEFKPWGMPLEQYPRIQNVGPGIRHQVDLKRFIRCVRVAPGTQRWVLDLIKDLSLRYGFDFPVEPSTIDLGPVF